MYCIDSSMVLCLGSLALVILTYNVDFILYHRGTLFYRAVDININYGGNVKMYKCKSKSKVCTQLVYRTAPDSTEITSAYDDMRSTWTSHIARTAIGPCRFHALELRAPCSMFFYVFSVFFLATILYCFYLLLSWFYQSECSLRKDLIGKINLGLKSDVSAESPGLPGILDEESSKSCIFIKQCIWQDSGDLDKAIYQYKGITYIHVCSNV